MVAAGEHITTNTWGRVIAESTRTANTSTFTTAETQLDSVTADIVSGSSYRIIWDGALFSSVAGDLARCRIRETNTSGTELMLRQKYLGVGGSSSLPLHMEVLWTAGSTGSQTFVATAARQSGTGTLGAQAGPTSPTSFRVELVV